MGVFEIQGNAERFVSYDVAVIHLSFRATGENSFVASKLVMKECEAFLGKLEQEGIAVADIRLEEDSVLEDRYQEGKKVRASRGLELRIPFQMDVINKIRQIVDENEYSIEFNLHYELSTELKIREELLQEALLNSKQKAEKLAASLGLKVTGVESLETYSTPGVDFRLCTAKAEAVRMDAAFEKSNQLQAKEEKLSETMNVKWNIG